MKFELNTDALPIFTPNLYGMSSNGMLDEFDFDTYEDLDDGVMEITENLVNDAVFDVIGSNTVVATGVRHPKTYNYNTDECDFTIEFDDENYEKVKNEVMQDAGFEKFLAKSYKSYDGFISFMADSIEEFEKEEDWKQFSQVILYKIGNRRRDYQDEFYTKMMEWCYENLDLIDDKEY